MALVVNSNNSSLNAQRQLMKSSQELNNASERLSSGKRINSAADDAAGLAISNRQTAQIKGLNQGVRNANDGISLIQTAEGALDESTNILQRMRELAIQAANGTNAVIDRTTIDAEVQQLKQELDRIANTTAFNGQTILDGSVGEVSLQVGADANQEIKFTLSNADSKSLGGNLGGDVVGTSMGIAVSAAANLVTGVASVGTLSINGQDVGDLSSADTMNQLLDTINGKVSGVQASSFLETTASASGTGVLRGAATMTLAMEDLNGNVQSYVIAETGSMNELVTRINEVTAGTIQASLNEDGKLALSAQTADNIAVTYGTGATVANTGLAASTYRAQVSFEITDSSITDVDITLQSTDTGAATINQARTTALSSAFGIQTRKDGDITGNLNSAQTAITEGHIVINDIALSGIAAGANASAHATNIAAAINAKSSLHNVVATANAGILSLNSVDGTEISLDFAGTSATLATTGLTESNSATGSGGSVADLNVSTAAGAQKAITVIDKALEQVNSQRAELGAVNNRLDFTVSNLTNVAENTSAARSRIVDADFAAETANLSRAQVLVQASQAMLAQANARPQQVLSLLN